MPPQPFERRQTTETDVGAFGVVVGEVERDRKVALLFAVQVAGVEALALDRSVDALDPSVRPRVVRLSSGVTDTEGPRALVEGPSVSRAVVGEKALDPDAARVEGRESVLEFFLHRPYAGIPGVAVEARSVVCEIDPV